MSTKSSEFNPLAVGFAAGAAAVAVAVGVWAQSRGKKKTKKEISHAPEFSPIPVSESAKELRKTFYFGDKMPPHVRVSCVVCFRKARHR